MFCKHVYMLFIAIALIFFFKGLIFTLFLSLKLPYVLFFKKTIIFGHIDLFQITWHRSVQAEFFFLSTM